MRISIPRLSLFVYAGEDSIRPDRGRLSTGDMHRRSVIYAPSGIIGEHISTKMSRYARLTLDIRFLRHYLGAYLRNESEVEKQTSKSPAAARYVTDREQAKFIFS